eukprot:COSAG02_NODE_24271_length_693_cov_1.161616_1_plen_49_part_10
MPHSRVRVNRDSCRRSIVLLSIMIVNELTVFASLTVRFLRGVCQVLRSA